MVEAEGRTVPFDGPEAIEPSVLETFDYEHPRRRQEIEISTDEFTAVCPYSGLPDFGTLTVRYVPSDRCLELKSLKYYLIGYRTVGIYQEHAANRVLDDLVTPEEPLTLDELALMLRDPNRGRLTTRRSFGGPRECTV